MTPAQAPTGCAEPGCPNLTTHGKFCTRCTKERTALHETSSYERERGSARERGYDKAWERRRRNHLELDPWCRRCGRGGRDVDHVIPHRGVKWLFDLEGNLQTLCQRHHTMKTTGERKMPIDLMYPLELPEPTRPVRLVCGPDVALHPAFDDIHLIDCNTNRVQRGACETIELFDGLEARNRTLKEELVRDTDVWLWVVLPAPRTAERAFWSHVLKAEATLVPPLYEDRPVEWWKDYRMDQRAEEAMERRAGG